MHISTLWAGVRVHVVPGDDVHPYVTGRPTGSTGATATRSRGAVVAVSSGGRHKRRLATAVIEEVHVGVPEVSMRETIDDVIEAGFAHAHPSAIIERLI